VELSHIQAFDEQLATQVQRRPAEMMIMLEQAVRLLARAICVLPTGSEGLVDPLLDLQVQLNSSTIPMTIRELDSHQIGRLVRIPGIVVSASSVIARPTSVTIVCRGCRTERQIPVPHGFGSTSLPRNCPG